MKYLLTTAQYMRVERKAGGVHASHRDLIKALHSILSPLAKTAEKKALRHAMIRDMLSLNESAKHLLRR